jgi:hypothetical protein
MSDRGALILAGAAMLIVGLAMAVPFLPFLGALLVGIALFT